MPDADPFVTLAVTDTVGQAMRRIEVSGPSGVVIAVLAVAYRTICEEAARQMGGAAIRDNGRFGPVPDAVIRKRTEE